MNEYKLIADHYIKEPAKDSCLFNYDAFVLRKNKQILTNQLFFQPDQVYLMDAAHPIVHVNNPKGIKQIPLALWPAYIQKLSSFTVTIAEHKKHLQLLKDHVKEHKHNALLFQTILRYINVFGLKEKGLIDDFEYGGILSRYTKYDFYCEESYIDEMLSSHTIKAEDKFISLRRRVEKMELSDTALEFLVEHDLVQHIRFFTATEDYAARVQILIDEDKLRQASLQC